MKPHSPLPWRIETDGGSSVVRSVDGERVCDGTDYYPTAVHVDDQKHIVRCVNAHEELVDALRDALRALEYDGDDDIPPDAVRALMRNARAALAKAEAQ